MFLLFNLEAELHQQSGGRVTVTPLHLPDHLLGKSSPGTLPSRMTQHFAKTHCQLDEMQGRPRPRQTGHPQLQNDLGSRLAGKLMSMALCSELSAPLCALEKGETPMASFASARRLRRAAVP